MDHKRDQFTFYRSYYDALADLPDRDFKATVLAVCAYALDHQEPELKGVRSTVFKLIRPVLDSGRRKAENRRKKGSGEEGCPIPEQTGTNGNKPEQTGKEKEKEREDESEKEKESVKETSEALLARGREELMCRYPPARLGNPQAARKALEGALRTREDLSLALENLELWQQSEQWEQGRFIPYLTNWVSRGCWRAAPPRPGVPKGGSGLGQAELEAIRQVLAQPAEGR